MLKKTIKYEDYLGNVRTEDFYFNLSKMELADMQMAVEGGFNVFLEKMVNADNKKEVYNAFIEIVLASYGEVSDDGRYFIKKDKDGNKLSEKFRQSPAYEILMDEITENTATIADFCKAVMPKSILDAANANDGKFVPQDHKKPENLRAYDPNK